ncbi:MAG: multidrug ABC transporter ATP-binding protein [Acidimicrobiia bacterium]|nr:MAG: multidrug ABC transporter ATP-binding protein [Acidimicrobiia bacterium]
MTNVIEIHGLRKEYRSRTKRTVAVDALDLAVPEGGVFGFLGPNGSGKTTTIRCLLGLVRPTTGHASVLGRPVPSRLPDVLPRVGAIVETPALFPTMTGRENLRLLAALDGIGRGRVDEVLSLVGLAERADDPVRKYSLGMRQRLGLAAALCKDPALLVLDEPANGLDPAGMREMRELMRRLGAEGRTVFLSSHLLSEVEQTCDRVAIVHRGRCVLAGRVEEVLSSAARSCVLVALDDLEGGRRVLHESGYSVERDGAYLRVMIEGQGAESVTRTLAASGRYVTELRPDTVTLEDLFLEITEREEVPA